MQQVSFKPGIAQEVELATMTITNIINKNLNIDVISKYMDLTDYVVGIGNDGIERGVYHKKQKKMYRKKNAPVLNTRKIKKQQKQVVNSERVNKNKERKDFYNQVTFITVPNGANGAVIDLNKIRKDKLKGITSPVSIINVKLFNNGRLVLVGCKSKDDAHKAGSLIVDMLNGNPVGKITYQISDNVYKDYNEREIVKYLSTYLKPLKAILEFGKSYCKTKYGVNNNIIDINASPDEIVYADEDNSGKTEIDEIGVDKEGNSEGNNVEVDDIRDVIALFDIELEELIGELRSYIPIKKKGRFQNMSNNVVTVPVKRLDQYRQKLLMSLIKIYNIMNIYFQPDDIVIVLAAGTQTMESKQATELLSMVIDAFSMNKMTIDAEFPVYIGDKMVYNTDTLKIDNIDCCFKLNFNINRANVQQILNNKYGLVSTYNSDSYQGVNSKYVSKASCLATDHKMCDCNKNDKKKSLCKCPCTCKEISNLIFRKGAVIVTGARNWEQVMDSYKHISSILISEYENIVSKQADALPKRIAKTVNSFNKDGLTYILPAHIRSNPKNAYLIEKYGFEHLSETK